MNLDFGYNLILSNQYNTVQRITTNYETNWCIPTIPLLVSIKIKATMTLAASITGYNGIMILLEFRWNCWIDTSLNPICGGVWNGFGCFVWLVHTKKYEILRIKAYNLNLASTYLPTFSSSPSSSLSTHPPIIGNKVETLKGSDNNAESWTHT